MIKRLLAAAILSLALSGCEDQAPPAPPTPPESQPNPTPDFAYKATPSPTLAAVRVRGFLACGVHPGLAGFAYPDVRGRWRGFDVDICRAVAAAVLGDAEKVRFTPIRAQDRFSALKRGEIDILSRNTSWSLSRDAGLGLDFAAITYFDGQGVLAPRALGLSSVDELQGAKICVLASTASRGNLDDYFRARRLTYRPLVVPSEAKAREVYQSDGGCDAFTADISALASARSMMNNPGSHVILPQVISKEPLGPVVRQDDPAWTAIVRWTVYALIEAEELGVSSKTVTAARAGSDPQVRRLLGVEGDLGATLGLPSDWALQPIRQVGAYDEVFRRNLGSESPLKLDRGLNALWTAQKPGLLYAPPLR